MYCQLRILPGSCLSSIYHLIQKLKENLEMDNSVRLPEEIVTEILLKLPVKSILKFKTVCKSWYSIINDTKFVQGHLRLARFAPHNNFFSPCYYGHYPSNPLLLYTQEADGTVHSTGLDIPPECQFASFHNSCDGLLCFFDRNREQILLWNPCLPSQVKIIPSPPYPDDEIALGYDPTSDDYKIVKIPCKWSWRNDMHVRVETFSFKSNSWETAWFHMCNLVDYLLLQALVYANNRFHWFAIETYEGGDMGACIMYFDLVEGSMKLMNAPPDDLLIFFTLMNHKESIATIGENFGNVIEYWVLEEYCGMKSSWKKVFSINCIRSPSKVSLCIGFTLNGESFVRVGEGGLRIYDSNDGSLVEGNSITYINKDGFHFLPFPFIQSLLSPRQLH